jgi:subtilisin family serine protease
MSVMGFTGERSGTGHTRRQRARCKGKREEAGNRYPRAAAPERLESRTLFSAATVAAVNVVWKGKTVDAYQDQWVVQTSHGTWFEKLATQQGFTGVQSLGGTGYYQFASTDAAAKIVRLAAEHPVALGTVQPNMVVSAADSAPDDTALSAQWGLINTGQLESYDYNNNGIVTPYDEQTYPNGIAPATTDFPTTSNPDENQTGTAGDDIDAQQAWDVTTGSKSVVVAVLDTGIDLTHPDLVGNIWTNPLDTAANNYDGDGYPGDINGYNFADDNSNPTDDNGHGTNVAGIIGAQGDNDQGVTGVDWNVSLVSVKVLGADGTGSDASVIAGINYVTNLKDHGINVVAMNESLGETAFPLDILMSDATRQAGKAGILDVVAAGNTSSNIDTTVATSANLFAGMSNVVTVAAVDNQGKLAAFSNYGASTVDIAAPGVNIYSTEPTYDFPLLDAQLDEESTEAAYYLPPGVALNYGYESGTSQAAPFVTGTIALEAAANPSATPAQLKRALLESATYDPNLAAANGISAKVATSGVVNAYRAVLAIQNPFVGTDATRQGSWVGLYGTQGAYVVGDSTAFPSGFVDVTTSGGSPVIVQNDTRNPAALQRATDPSERVSAYEGSATSETINLTFTTGDSYATRLYVVDPDHKHRTETISVVDAATGLTLDTESVSDFTKGEYLTWDLRGSVEMVITSQGGGAAYSGLFFDVPDASPSTFYNLDATTTGANWRNQYGSQGDQIFGDDNTGDLPSYVSVFSVVGGTNDLIRPDTQNSNALQRNDVLEPNIEDYYASATYEDVNVAMTDGLVHTVTLYVADYKRQHLTEQVQVLDSASGGILATEELSNFKQGQFVSFNVSGAVTFRITRTGGPDAVVSGVFFDGAFGEDAHYVDTDATTLGNWTGSNYGATDAYVVGDDFPGLDAEAGNVVSITGATEEVLASATTNPRALLRVGNDLAGSRVEAYAFTTSSMTINYAPGDYVQHQLALYFADYDNDKRVETVTLTNPTTGTVLAHQTVSNFRNGKYLIYDVTGPIQIVIQDVAYPNAVLSGLFVD